ncbi:MAG TPA: glycosyltransferase [Candidatus Binataceae bacterium]|jgi:glycosyltransferase involved in cell wall biosynthesis|nr:glycosyltransferase [Candidatus Binataceae bacterium]
MTAAIPKLSVIVPAHDAAATIADCLQAACAQAGGESEIIVVDDCSTDATAEIAGRFPVRLLPLPFRSGVAAARNAGARAARGAIVLFLDADVVPAGDLFVRGCAAMAQDGVDAVIGSYDAQPAVRTTVSLFKNLAHHYFHQQARREAATFWGACGFIRRDLFIKAGGFDQERYLLPSIEDVELGARLMRGGARIVLDPDLHVTHLKRWTLPGLLKTDVLRRAIPWTLLALDNGGLPADLNFTWRQRMAALTAAALPAALMGTLRWSWMAAVVGATLGVAVMLNRDLYRLFYDKGGVRLAVCGFMLQQLYYLYSIAGLTAGTLIHLARKIAKVKTACMLALLGR